MALGLGLGLEAEAAIDCTSEQWLAG